MSYSVLTDPGREPLRTPTLEMPEDIKILAQDGTWEQELISDNSTPMLRIYPTAYHNGEVGIYTDSACKNKIDYVETVPKRIYKKVLGKRVIFNYSYVPIFLKLQPLEPGDYTFYAQSKIGESFSECSTDLAEYTLLAEQITKTVIDRPTPPTSVTVSHPSGVVSSMEHSPSFLVDGVLPLDTVRLHRDSECLLPLKRNENEVLAEDTSVLLQESELYVGNYTVYASTTRNGVRSDCSTSFASYEVLAPKPLPPKSIKVVGARTGRSATPLVIVGDGYRVYKYDEVKLYTDFNCSTQVGSSVADYKPPGVWYDSGSYFSVRIRTKELSAGEHTFYATVTRDGRQSNCSRPGDSYEVLVSDNDIGMYVSPPQYLKLVRPKSSSSIIQRPVFRVGGVKKNDTVSLFVDEQCTQKIGENIALKKGSIKIRSWKLGVGTYRFMPTEPMMASLRFVRPHMWIMKFY